jgi:hypothetical protein
MNMLGLHSPVIADYRESGKRRDSNPLRGYFRLLGHDGAGVEHNEVGGEALAHEAAVVE